MFVNPKATAEVRHGDDVVTIRAKMSLAVQASVNDELVSIRLDMSRARAGEEMETADMRIGALRQRLALLKHNVKSWSGPSFTDERGRAIPCTPAQIELIEDIDHPLWEKVMDEINRRNQAQTEYEPKPAVETDPKGSSTSEA